MKKMYFFLVILLTLTLLLTACDSENDDTENKTQKRITAIDEYYKRNGLVCWQDIAAVYLAEKDIIDYDYKEALTEPESLSDKAGYVISISLLERQGNNISGYKMDKYIPEVKEAIEKNYKKSTVKELALCFYAMVASDTDFDNTATTEYLEELQNDDGGFPASNEYVISDTESSAYALNIIMLSRDNISDNCYDSVLVFLANSITDINVIKDIEGKDSSLATSLTLNSLIAANIPINGEISTALTEAIDTNFRYERNSIFYGYKKYPEDTDIDREATGEVMLCFASTAYGNIWKDLE